MPYLKAASVVSFLMILSSLLGFLREIFIAKSFGLSSEMDCFVVAFSIISFIFLIFNPPTIQTVFMPLYQGFLSEDAPLEASKIFNSCFYGLSGVLILLSSIIYTCGDFYLPFLMPGFKAAQIELTIQAIKTLTPLVFFFGISSLLHAVCNAHHRFMGPLLSQVINNLVLVLFIWSCGISSILVLSDFYLIGGGLSVLIVLGTAFPFLEKKLRISSGSVIKNLFAHASPLFILIFFDQVAALLQKSIASGLSLGSISALNYATKLVSFPVTIFAIAISTVLFPLFINAVNRKDQNLLLYFKKGVILIVYCLVPASIFFCLESKNMVATLLSSHHFDELAVIKTSSALFYYSLGIVFQGLLIYLNRIYFACRQSLVFVKLGLICMVLHILLCWALAQKIGHDGIALATSAYAAINVALLFYYLKKSACLSFDYQQFIKPLACGGLAILTSLCFPHKVGFLNLLQSGFLITTSFFASLLLMRDKNLKEILFSLKKPVVIEKGVLRL